MAEKTAAAVAEPDDLNDQPDEANDVEKRLSKLEKLLTESTKVLEEERKASSGKDKKIVELANAKKELEQATFSKDKLLEIKEKELEEKEAKMNAENASERSELERLRIEMERHKVISKFENFPAFLIDRVRGNTPDDIEADVRQIMKVWIKERDKVDNATKLGPRPKSGSGKQINVSADDVAHMSAQDKTKWAQNASKEEFDVIFDALHGGEN